MAKRGQRFTRTTMEILRPLHAALGSDYPEIWRTIAECIYIGILDDVSDVELRVKMTIRATDVQRAELGGQQPYLPKGGGYDAACQYRELYARFNGRNIPELAAESGVCIRVLYKHFAVLRQAEIEARQDRLAI